MEKQIRQTFLSEQRQPVSTISIIYILNYATWPAQNICIRFKSKHTAYNDRLYTLDLRTAETPNIRGWWYFAALSGLYSVSCIGLPCTVQDVFIFFLNQDNRYFENCAVNVFLNCCSYAYFGFIKNNNIIYFYSSYYDFFKFGWHLLYLVIWRRIFFGVNRWIKIEFWTSKWYP